MLRLMRWPAMVLGCLTMVGATVWASPFEPSALQTPAQEPPRQQPETPRPDVAPLFSQRGDDPPSPFVPLRPGNTDDRQRIEALRLYSSARALEDRGAFNEAVELLQQAQKLDPESVAITRRLGRIYVGALGRPDLAVEAGKKVLAVEPGDTDTLSRLVEFFLRKNDTGAAESLLREVLANPKLEANAPGRLVAQNELGKLYASRLNQVEKAADAFAEVMAGLDDKAANQLSPLDQVRILGNEPALAYLIYGNIFLAAKRDDLAIKAFERGLVYDEENPQIPLLLAEILLKQNKGQQALALVDRYIKRQPQALEAYDLLAKVLTALKRENEITPRLEEAAKADSKNVPLQYALADRYRETGQTEKADAIYNALLATQPTPQAYKALATSLLKRKKAGELLKVICEAMNRPNGVDAVSVPLQEAANDDAFSEAILDEGLKMLEGEPPASSKTLYFVLSFIANPDRGMNKQPRLERLIKLQNLLLKQNPDPRLYREIADTLQRMEKYDEAAATLVQMIEKFPNEKNGRTLGVIAELQRRAGKPEAALETATQAIQADGDDAELQRVYAEILGDGGKVDEAVAALRKAVASEPEDPRYKLLLGGLFARYGRNDEAIKVFQEVLKQYPNQDELLRITHSNLSIVYVNQGDYAKGEAELEVLFQKAPDDPSVNNDLGYLYADQGKNLEKAETMIRKAVQDDPERPAYLDSLGWVLFKRGKAKEALEPLQKAVELQKLEEQKGLASPDATIREHLGDVLAHLQEVTKAQEMWAEAERIAAKAVPPDKRLPEIRKKLDSLKELGSIPKNSSSENP